jgi:hypothetical protein
MNDGWPPPQKVIQVLSKTIQAYDFIQVLSEFVQVSDFIEAGLGLFKSVLI